MVRAKRRDATRSGDGMKRQKDNKPLDFIRSLPCVICLDNTSTEAAHIRYADRQAGKRQTGMQEKSDDAFAIPLCGECHRAQHGTSERAWWNGKEIDPVKLALALYRISGDAEAGTDIVQAYH